MPVAGELITLTIDKPAAGGRMIGRFEGQVILVNGAIPGERVTARIERLGKGLAYADTVAVLTASPDRREPFTDPQCGGTLYAHIDYPRQLTLKAQVILDTCARIGRFNPPLASAVRSSPDEGYRMRARLHVQGGRAGFFREGTHTLCDIRSTRQLLGVSCDAIESLTGQLRAIDPDLVHEIDLAENTDGSERVLHLGLARGKDARSLHTLSLPDGASGLVTGEPSSSSPGIVIAGSPYVTDAIKAGSDMMRLRRHVLAFFQGNRYLLPDLVAYVVDAISPGTRVVDLYAGVGLFSVAAVQARRATVVAVEGDPVASSDLAANIRGLDGIEAVHQSVETFTARTRVAPDLLLVDPPRTGMSKEALSGALRMKAPRILYVSCDAPTFARDARRLLDAGYALERLEGFDLFPNTPHVETVALFERR